MSDIKDIIIIGSGPAGNTSALYASRGDLKTLVLEGWQPGGQPTTTTIIENYPGFENGIDGNQLVQEMKKQAMRFGAEYITATIDKVDFSSQPFKVYAGDDEYQAKAVIIATGAKPRMLGLDSEKRLWAKGVSSCATCDGFFYRDKVVAVIGGGDSAMEEASFLTKFASKVYLIHRRNEFRSSKVMFDRVKSNEKIEILTNKTVEDILGDEKVTATRLKDTVTGEESEIAIDGLFLAIGRIPSTEFLAGVVETDKQGYIIHKTNSMTSIEGIFAGGDCVDHRYRQAITAASEGCKSAIDAQRWLAD